MKIIAFFGLLVVSTNSFSQEYKRFNFGIGTGSLIAGDIRPGALLYLEPAYDIRKNISIGIKLEGALGTMAPNGLTGIGSYSVNGNYFFSKNELRGFAGMGVGFYNVGSGVPSGCGCSPPPDYTTTSVKDKNVLGVYPRVGFVYMHFTASLECNVMTSTRELFITTYQGQETTSVNYYHSNYLSLKVGFRIGGALKKPE